jgi:multicomponent Na+:H+ antiporter subunit A
MTRRSVILEVCVRAEFHTLVLISLYLLFAGHNQPGGGFAGGLVASCAFCLLFVAGGEGSVRRVLRIPPTTLLGVGMLCSILTGVVSLALGGEFLESAVVERSVDLLGKVKGSSVLFFDIGVYLVVLGMVLLLLEQLGSADGRDHDPEGDDTHPGGTEMQP